MMWYGGRGWWMFLWMLLLWAGVILIILWSVRLSSGGAGSGGSSGRGRALELLEERYARGEIDREEFEDRRSVLKSK